MTVTSSPPRLAPSHLSFFVSPFPFPTSSRSFSTSALKIGSARRGEARQSEGRRSAQGQGQRAARARRGRGGRGAGARGRAFYCPVLVDPRRNAALQPRLRAAAQGAQREPPPRQQATRSAARARGARTGLFGFAVFSITRV